MLLPSLARVREATFVDKFDKWEEKHQREYDWTARGKSSEAAVWRTLLDDEVCQGGPLAYSTVLMDLAKASGVMFEKRALQAHRDVCCNEERWRTRGRRFPKKWHGTQGYHELQGCQRGQANFSTMAPKLHHSAWTSPRSS